MKSSTASKISTVFWIGFLGVCVMTCSKVDWDKPEKIEAHAEVSQTTCANEIIEPKYTVYEVPDGKTSFKSYMDYRAITNVDSEQYKFQKDCWTDDNGLRRYEDDYVVALGTFYASDIGERFRITLDNDKSFYAVVGDFKAPQHTDSTNRYTPTKSSGKCVVEFVVDTQKLDKSAKKMGDISYCGFKGNVKKIEKEE